MKGGVMRMSPRRMRPAAKPMIALAALASAALVAGPVLAVTGNISPSSIEIDANLFDDSATGIDWVKDSLANTDTDPDPNDNIAIGITPGVSGATGGTGHWNGVRIVDRVAQADQDIFLTGGKENDTSTWNVGPGSVGSAKYDITQAYLANNQQKLFFGMERRGNNGTTAFDFEFNQAAPVSTYIPTRTIGDVLFTFEMQGSGGSGSAVPHYFTWSGSAYVEQTLPSGVAAMINDAAIDPEPWGYVNDKGNWVLSPDIPRFQFAEATAPLSLLPGVNACGGSAYTQVRTRSSSTDNSDLKDTTKVFQFLFESLTVTAAKASASGTDLTVTASASPTTLASYQWQKRTGASSWANISGATGSSITYSNFEADDFDGASATSFSLGGDSYAGKIYAVDLRVHGTDSSGCSDDSDPVTVKKVIAVDP